MKNDKDRGNVNNNVHKGHKDFIHNKGFNCLYTNADSLVNKIEELKRLAANTQPKVIAICEAKPKNSRYNITEAEI